MCLKICLFDTSFIRWTEHNFGLVMSLLLLTCTALILVSFFSWFLVSKLFAYSLTIRTVVPRGPNFVWRTELIISYISSLLVLTCTMLILALFLLDFYFLNCSFALINSYGCTKAYKSYTVDGTYFWVCFELTFTNMHCAYTCFLFFLDSSRLLFLKIYIHFHLKYELSLVVQFF